MNTEDIWKEIIERLTRVETTVETGLNNIISKLEESNKRTFANESDIKSLQGSRNWMLGALAVLTFIISVFR